MKQITYRLLTGGNLTDPAIPAIIASASALRGVRRVELIPADGDEATITLVVSHEVDASLEDGLASILSTKGMELVRESRTELDLPEDTPETGRPIEGARHYVTSRPPKKGRTVPLSAAIATSITAVILAVLLTFSLSAAYLRPNTPLAPEEDGNVFDQLEFIDRLFRSATVLELGEDFPTRVLKAYVAATGDTYAEYFTAEELEVLMGEQNGEMCGIGVTVVSDICTVGGMDYQAIVVANVYPDSPAEEAGVLPGDCIMYVGIGEDAVLINEIGYTEALNRMAGEEGTECTFTVYRPQSDGSYDRLEFTATRRKLTTRSVTYRTYDLDETVGIIKITGFDNTTRAQLDESITALQALGCTSFVLDLRSNPGGMLTSIEDVLTYFLSEGDVMISMKDNSGSETITKLTVNTAGRVTTGSGEMTAEDVGKYRDLRISVLVNGYSASAAELFTANMRDHKLAAIVGTTTFGKGSVQSTFPLASYGFEGALKLTTAYYYPPSDEGYHGIGIEPDIPVELDEAYANTNLNLLTDEQDNQLAAAVAAAKADTPGAAE